MATFLSLRLFDPIGGKVIIGRDVVYSEDKSWNWNFDTPIVTKIVLHGVISSPTTSVAESNYDIANDNTLEDSAPNEHTIAELLNSQDNSIIPSSETPPTKVRALRNVYESCSYELNVTDPTSYEEAQQFQVRKDAI